MVNYIHTTSQRSQASQAAIDLWNKCEELSKDLEEMDVLTYEYSEAQDLIASMYFAIDQLLDLATDGMEVAGGLPVG